MHAAVEISLTLLPFWYILNNYTFKTIPTLCECFSELNILLQGIECHFLLWCLHITQDDGVGFNVERDLGLKIYANGKSRCHKVWSCHTHIQASLKLIHASHWGHNRDT